MVTHTHRYIHRQAHAYLQPYSDIQLYIFTNMPAAYIHTDIHIHANIHTYIHTNRTADRETHTHTDGYIQNAGQYKGNHTYRDHNIHIHTYIHTCSLIQTHTYIHTY